MHENHFRGVRSVLAVSRSGSFLLQHFPKASRSTDDVEMTKASKILPFTPFQMMDFQALEAKAASKVAILQRVFLLGCCIFREFLHLKRGPTPQLLNLSRAETILHQEEMQGSCGSCCNNSLFYDHFRYHFGLPTNFY